MAARPARDPRSADRGRRVGAMVAMTAVLLVFQYGQTRIFMVMSRLPPVFSRVHARFRTPHVSTWITGLVVALSCSILTPDQAIGLTNIGTLIVLRAREPDRPRPFRVPGYPVTPIRSALACFGLVLGLERSNGLRLATGLVLYSPSYSYCHSRLRRELLAREPGGPSRATPASASVPIAVIARVQESPGELAFSLPNRRDAVKPVASTSSLLAECARGTSPDRSKGNLPSPAVAGEGETVREGRRRAPRPFRTRSGRRSPRGIPCTSRCAWCGGCLACDGARRTGHSSPPSAAGASASGSA